MYSSVEFAGNQPFNDWFTPDTTQRHPLNMNLNAVDPFWGYGQFIYGKAAAALSKGNLVVQQATLGTYDKVPNTANLGQNVLVAMNTMAINTFGWFIRSGLAVYATTATVAANAAIGLTGAGTVGANTAGKQILGVTNLKSAIATQTFTNTQTTNGSSVLVTNGYDGAFLGMALSGTGIPAATVVAKLDPDGRTIYMGSAIGTIDKLATATGGITLTGTYTGFGLGVIDAPFVQGAIT